MCQIQMILHMDHDDESISLLLAYQAAVINYYILQIKSPGVSLALSHIFILIFIFSYFVLFISYYRIWAKRHDTA